MAQKHKLNNWFYTLIIIYVTLLLTDFTTTITLPHYKVLEVNTAFTATGSMIFPILANILLIWIVWHIQHSTKFNQVWKYTAILMLVSITIIRLFAISNAIEWHQNPPTLEEAQAIATPENIAATRKTIAIGIYLPAFVGLIAFLFWWKTHKQALTNS